ncbi:hypothetical protein HGRIS_008318 [Hohenbuehelia grisea]|uniref:Radical SAM core domain-containing protein n=1 Tax=Hohenbuehelia grisea TaxID=104357 RepID=A0ABR3J833_9AGAR
MIWNQGLRFGRAHSRRCLQYGRNSVVEFPRLASSKAGIQVKIAQIDSERPFEPALIDGFKRKHDYLRISLTERCNLRCFYCMPEEGIELSPKEHLLTNDEVIRLATLFVKSGVTKIRLTGGEPTIRKGIVDIIARLNDLRSHGLEAIAITSNGLALHRHLPTLIQNGLTHLNLSLDTLDPFKFELMTRRRGHELVLRTLDIAMASPSLQSLKLNVVIIKGLNDVEVLDFVEMTKDKNISVRFIEFMPFTGNNWNKSKMVPSSALLDRIRTRHPGLMRAPDELNDTARSWSIPGYAGSFGFISSMSDHFCASCNRLRITADGQIKVCLFDAKEVSLRDFLRSGASDDDLLRLIGKAVQGKQEKHAGMEDIDVVTNRPMILIGDPGSPATRSFRVYRHLSTVSNRKQAPRRYFSVKTPAPPPSLTHIDEHGRPSMVDVGEKLDTQRSATAAGRIYIPAIAYALVTSTSHKDPVNLRESAAVNKARQKGQALTVAQLAAIMGSKQTSNLIPLCHPLALTNVSVTLVPEAPEDSVPPSTSDNLPRQRNRHSILCTATVSCVGKTGVEMEALTAVSVGLLTVWDMLKAVAGKEMEIGEIFVAEKAGGKSGNWKRSHNSITED